MRDTKDGVRKIIMVMAGLSVSVTISILCLIKGWGLEPKNWTWIIVMPVVGQIIALTLIELGKDK